MGSPLSVDSVMSFPADGATFTQIVKLLYLPSLIFLYLGALASLGTAFALAFSLSLTLFSLLDFLAQHQQHHQALHLAQAGSGHHTPRLCHASGRKLPIWWLDGTCNHQFDSHDIAHLLAMIALSKCMPLFHSLLDMPLRVTSTIFPTLLLDISTSTLHICNGRRSWRWREWREGQNCLTTSWIGSFSFSSSSLPSPVIQKTCA